MNFHNWLNGGNGRDLAEVRSVPCAKRTYSSNVTHLNITTQCTGSYTWIT